MYGRRLASVYLDGANLERELLQKGYARLLVIETNHAPPRHARQRAERPRATRGLWQVREPDGS